MRQTPRDLSPEQHLAVAMDRSRPWTDEALVARELADWACRHHEGQLSAGDLRVVAIEIRRTLDPYPTTDAESIAFAVSVMLQNVAEGRDPLKSGDVLGRTVFKYLIGPVKSPQGLPYPPPLSDPPREPAVPDRTRRHHRQQFGPFGALDHFLQRWASRNDLSALTKGNRLHEGGRSEKAARRWLQRNPRTYAKDAPPPRKRKQRESADADS
jgi:hypothetical protein